MNTNYVLIDFENVQPESLQLLTQEHFKVLIFVGASQNSLPFALADSMQQLGCRAKYVKVSANRPNALDFHIAYYLGRLATSEPTARFHVISKDTGYDPLIEHLHSQQIPVRRVATIAEIPPIAALAKSVTQSTMTRITQPVVGPAIPLSQTAVQPTSSAAIASSAQLVIKAVAKPAGQPSVNPVARPAIIAPAKSSENVAVTPATAKSSREQLAVVLAQLRKSPANRPRTLTALCHSIKSWLGRQTSEADVAKVVQSLKCQKYLRVTDAKKLEYEFAQPPVASASGLTKKVKTTLPPK